MTEATNTADTPPPFVPPEGIEGYGGRPGLATALCALLLVASCVGSMGMPAGATPPGGAETIGRLVGGASLGAILWGIAYAITIKRASPRAKILSLAVLTTLGLATALVALGRSREATRTDMRAAASEANRTVAGLEEGRTMRVGVDAGPLTRLTAIATNDTLAIVRRYNAEAKAAGLDQVTGFVGLTRASPVLDRCERVTALEDRASATRRELAGVGDRLRRDGETMVARGELSRSQLDAFLAGAVRGQQGLDRQWALVGDLARDGGVLCGILARRRWQLGPDGAVLFTDRSDLARAQPVLARIHATGAAIEARKSHVRDNLQRTSAEVERL